MNNTTSNEISTTIKGVKLTLKTASTLFSPRYVDPGTQAMLSVVEFSDTDKVLDLGCGYGVMGILVAKLIGPDKVVMVDNDSTAVQYARSNADLNGVKEVKVLQSDGFENFDESGFTLILCNPPYHEDFSVAKHFVQKGFNRLVIGGRVYMVTKRRKWYENKLRGIFGGVKVHEINGYNVFMSIKKSYVWAKVQANSKKGPTNKKERWAVWQQNF